MYNFTFIINSFFPTVEAKAIVHNECFWTGLPYLNATCAHYHKTINIKKEAVHKKKHLRCLFCNAQPLLS